MRKIKKEWTENLTITEEERNGLKEIMKQQEARREAARLQREEETRSLEEIMEQQKARRKAILGY